MMNNQETIMFLVNCKVKIMRYMEDGYTTQVVSHIVLADSESEMKQKMYNFYESKCDPYYEYYSVEIISYSEAIK